MKRVIVVLCIALFAFWGCKGKNSGSVTEGKSPSDNGSVPDNPKVDRGADYQPPSIFMRFPDLNAQSRDVAVSADAIDINADCYGDIVSVSLLNKKTGKSFNGSYTDGRYPCKIPSVILSAGDNELVAKVHDKYGETMEDSVIVTYNQGGIDVGSLVMSETSFFEDKPEIFTIEASVLGNKTIEKAFFVLTDNKTQETVLSVELSLQGETDGIKTYTGSFDSKGMKEGFYTARAGFDTGGISNYSAPVAFDGIRAGYQTDLQQNTDMFKYIGQKYFTPEQRPDLSAEEYHKYKLKAAEEIRKLSGVTNVYLPDNGDYMSITFSSGVNGSIIFRDWENVWGGGSQTNNNNTENGTYNKNIQLEQEEKIKEKKMKKSFFESPKKENNFIGLTETLNVTPFFKHLDAGYNDKSAYARIKKSKEPVFPITHLIDENVTLDNLKKLSKYGIVIISGHGMLHRDVPWEPYYFMLATREKVTEDSKDKYARDIARKYLSYIKYRGEEYFAIRYQFIVTYNKSFKNSLIYLDVCEAFTQPYFPYAFLAQGAGAIVGYDATVPIVYASATGNSLFKYLLEDNTVGKSVNKARDENNTDSGAPYYAKLSVTGNKSLKIVDTGLKNGGFEENEEKILENSDMKYTFLKHWNCTYQGKDCWMSDAIIISSPWSSYPILEGQQSVWFGVGGISALYQKFTIPKDAKTLSFSYKYAGHYIVGSESYNKCASLEFHTTLMDPGGDVIDLLSYDFSDMRSLNIDRISGFSYGACQYVHCAWYDVSSPWQTLRYSVSEFAGREVELRFLSSIEKSFLDACGSGVYLDNITIQ